VRSTYIHNLVPTKQICKLRDTLPIQGALNIAPPGTARLSDDDCYADPGRIGAYLGGVCPGRKPLVPQPSNTNRQARLLASHASFGAKHHHAITTFSLLTLTVDSISRLPKTTLFPLPLTSPLTSPQITQKILIKRAAHDIFPLSFSGGDHPPETDYRVYSRLNIRTSDYQRAPPPYLSTA
jgi:hypothetical protein